MTRHRATQPRPATSTASPGAGKVVVAYERSGEVWTAVRVH